MVSKPIFLGNSLKFRKKSNFFFFIDGFSLPIYSKFDHLSRETILYKKFLEVSEPFFKKVLTRRRQKLMVDSGDMGTARENAEKIVNLHLERGWFSILKSFLSILQRFINSFIHFIVRPDIFVFGIFAFVRDFGVISPDPFLFFLFTFFFRGVWHFLIAYHLDPWSLHKFL